MIRPLARQKGLTELGNTYVLTQDAPNKIHLTIQRGDYLINDTLENLKSEEEMINRRNQLEKELMEWINPHTENTNEANKSILLPTGSDSTSGAGLGITNPESV